jgi:hypothetical protein
MTESKSLLELAERVEALTGPHSNNGLDVLCEVALFKPDDSSSAARPNSAGTKVVYTDRRSGRTVAHWAREWTCDDARQSTAAALRTLSAKEPGQ